jgi:hypothetical protein
MSNFKKYPAIYTDAEEKEVVHKFQKHFDEAHRKKLVKLFNQQEEAIVPFDLFKKLVGKVPMTDDHLDCAYIYLCRGVQGPFKPPSPLELLEKIRGFDSQKISMLFGEEVKLETSDDDYSMDKNS